MAMFNFQIESAPVTPASSPPTPGFPPEVVDLLKQLVDLQREQLQFLRAAHDSGARWRAFLTRWQEQFPTLGQDCRAALPTLEQCYGRLLNELTEHLSGQEDEPLDNDFALQDFLDRHGMRLSQLGTILNLVAPLADAAPGETSS